MYSAYWVRSPPCSTALSHGPSACDHWLSVRPSQKSHGECAVPAIGIVRRPVTPTPCASGVLSWKSRPGRWHVAHETLPLELSFASKKSWRPKRAAFVSSATRLLGSGARDSSLSSVRLASIVLSSADHLSDGRPSIELLAATIAA